MMCMLHFCSLIIADVKGLRLSWKNNCKLNNLPSSNWIARPSSSLPSLNCLWIQVTQELVKGTNSHAHSQSKQKVVMVKSLAILNTQLCQSRSPKGSIEKFQIQWVIISCLLVQLLKSICVWRGVRKEELKFEVGDDKQFTSQPVLVLLIGSSFAIYFLFHCCTGSIYLGVCLPFYTLALAYLPSHTCLVSYSLLSFSLVQVYSHEWIAINCYGYWGCWWQ